MPRRARAQQAHFCGPELEKLSLTTCFGLKPDDVYAPRTKLFRVLSNSSRLPALAASTVVHVESRASRAGAGTKPEQARPRWPRSLHPSFHRSQSKCKELLIIFGKLSISRRDSTLKNCSQNCAKTRVGWSRRAPSALAFFRYSSSSARISPETRLARRGCARLASSRVSHFLGPASVSARSIIKLVGPSL